MSPKSDRTVPRMSVSPYAVSSTSTLGAAEEQFATVSAHPERIVTAPSQQPPPNLKEAGNELIEQALARHGGKVKPAAEELGISERTIYRFLAKQRSSR